MAMTPMNAPALRTEPITLLVCALGGEGGGVLNEWLFDTALRCGHAAQATSVPGVAQRTGATTYYLEVCPLPDAELAGRTPVFSLNPVPGAIDLLVSSELLETVRQIGAGMARADRTQVISSSARALTVAEKMPMGDGRADAAPLLAQVQRHSRSCLVLDLDTLAREAGTVISAVLLGAVAASGMLPWPRQAYEDTVRASGKGVQASLHGFALGFEAVQRSLAQQQAAAQFMARTLPAQVPPGAASPPPAMARQPVPPPLPEAWRQRFPVALHELLALGRARLVEYQDAAYAEWYADRLAAVLEAERAADPGASASQGLAASRECARWLALWMAFDDIVRVAALKASARRWQRVQREVAVREDEVVKLYDHFKPGVAEFAALLPPGLARRVQAWDAGRRARGLEPWALPLKIGTHTVVGMLALRLLAALKGQRRRGSRFAHEQALIERWLAAVVQGLRADWTLGHEVAQCGRLIKGYGSTNERGKANLLLVIDQLAVPAFHAAPAARAAAVLAARQAALADDAGLALDRTLVAHGAAPRPLVAQPLRFYKRRPGRG